MKEITDLLTKLILPVAKRLSTPRMEIIAQEPFTFYGWKKHDANQFAVLLTVKFTNEKDIPFFLNTIEVYYQGGTYKPIAFPGDHPKIDIELICGKVSRSSQKLRNQNIPNVRKILAHEDQEERWALYHLPSPNLKFPTSLQFNVKPRFTYCRSGPFQEIHIMQYCPEK